MGFKEKFYWFIIKYLPDDFLKFCCFWVAGCVTTTDQYRSTNPSLLSFMDMMKKWSEKK